MSLLKFANHQSKNVPFAMTLFRRVGAVGLGIYFVVVQMLYTAGCGSKSNTGTTFTSGTFSAIYNETILTSPNCTTCHSPTGSATLVNGVQMDFSSQALAYSSVTGNHLVRGSSKIGTCGTVKLVEPGSTINSYFLAVVDASFNTSNFAGVSGCTPYNVHHSDLNLTDAEKQSIQKWIQDGALNN